MENNTIKTLDYLLQLKADKKKTTKMEIGKFCESWLDLALSEGYTARAEKYLYGGISYCGAKPLFLFIMQSNNKEEIVKQFLTGNLFGQNMDSSFRLLANLLALLLNDKSHGNLVKQIVVRFPQACMNKEKKLLGTIDGIMTKWFFLYIDPDAELIPLVQLGLKSIFVDDFVNCMETILCTIKTDGLAKIKISNIEKVRKWIADYTSNSISVVPANADDISAVGDVKGSEVSVVIPIVADAIEPTTPPVVEAITIASDGEILPTVDVHQKELVPVSSDTGADESGIDNPADVETTDEAAGVKEAHASTKAEYPEHSKGSTELADGDPVADLSSLLIKACDAVAAIKAQKEKRERAIDALTAIREVDQSNLALARQKIAELQDTVEMLTQKMAVLEEERMHLIQTVEQQESVILQANTDLAARQDTITSLRSQVMSAEADIAKLKKELVEREATISAKEAEIEERKTMAEVLSRDRARQADELVQKMASKIRVEYQDFQDALDMEMTCDLGENLRLQLQNIFDILEKGGMKIK